nr:response regulator [Paenibacillus daejeonensis]
MYTVLIVDDEYYFRQALKVSLPWAELGLQLIGEAKNGEDALELMRNLHPDIIMVDINMPIMDGLTFIAKARSEGFHSKFIVLTGHSEFTYAKHAIQLGVSNYVLKPIDAEEIQSSLNEMKQLINHERHAKLELDDLKKQAVEKASLQRTQALNDWLLGNLDPEHQDELLLSLGIDTQSTSYRTAVIELAGSERDSPSGLQDKAAMRRSLPSLVHQLIDPTLAYEGFFNEKGQFALIFGVKDKNMDDIGGLCQSIGARMAEDNGWAYTIGLGNGHDGMEAVSDSYKEALYALKHRYLLGGNRVIEYSHITRSVMRVNLYSMDKRSSLLKSMRTGNALEVEAWLSEFFDHARLQHASLDMLLVAGFEIYSTCLEFLEETSQDIHEIVQSQSEPDLFGLIERMDSLGEFEDWIRSLISKMIVHVHAKKTSRSAVIVEEVKSYITTHYRNEELKIEDIARGVHMNYTHLCYVFKKETSTTINDYLTQIRMQKAKELFDQGYIIVQDVASRVGYSDANYFGKCYKKYSGITPSKYISNINKG